MLLYAAAPAQTSPPPAGAARVQITFPAGRRRRPRCPRWSWCKALAATFGPARKSGVFTRNPGDTHLNPQPQAAVLSPDGSWSSQTFVGSAGNAGKRFQILVAVADAAAATAITDYLANAHQTGNYPGLTNRPAGARRYGQVSVIRQGAQTSPPPAGAARVQITF